jgi:hypothetical protein
MDGGFALGCLCLLPVIIAFVVVPLILVNRD